MWQSLVTIGPETSEISRRKKRSKRIETSAVKYNGRRPASWRAAIINPTYNDDGIPPTLQTDRRSYDKNLLTVLRFELCYTVGRLHIAVVVEIIV